MNVEKLIEEFKSIYQNKGPDDLLGQVKYLSQLADYYHQKGKHDSDWTCLLKAHALYNSTASRDTENGQKWSERAFDVQQTYWDGSVSIVYKEQREITQTIKQALMKVRQTTKNSLDGIQQNYINFNCEFDKLVGQENQELYENFMDKMESVSQTCTKSMIEVFNLIISKSVEIVGEPPCGLCVAAMGSLARGEATPYSDLEFMFLIETESEEKIQYFERLAMTVYFQIGNLQETKLKYMAIDELHAWFEDLAVSGLKIDGLQPDAGNIPTGNRTTGEKRNHLMCTVSKMALRYKLVYDQPNLKESVRGDLSAMLSCTVLLYQHGSVDLHSEFRSAVNEFKPNSLRKSATAQMFKADEKKYNFYPDASMDEKLNLKSAIYRYPSMYIHNLRIFFHLELSSSEVIAHLAGENFLKPLQAFRLRLSYCCALYIRLSAYLFHKSQNESISVLSQEQGVHGTPDMWYIDRPLLLHMLIHLMPLKSKVNEKLGDLQLACSAALVSSYCGDYQDGYDVLHNAMNLHAATVDSAEKYAFTCALLLTAYLAAVLGKTDEAEKILSRQEIDCVHLDPTHKEQLKEVYLSLSGAFLMKFQLEKAISYIHKGRETGILKEKPNISFGTLQAPNVEAIMEIITEMVEISFNEISDRLTDRKRKQLHSHFYEALICLFQEKNSKAEALFGKALDLSHDIYGNSTNTLLTAALHLGLGACYGLQNKSKQSDKSYSSALRLFKRLSPGKDHPAIAMVDFSRAISHIHQGKWNSAADLLNKSVEAMENDVIYRSLAAEFYCILSSADFCNGKYKSAAELLMIAIEMANNLGKDSPFSDDDTISAMVMLSYIQRKCGEYNEAERWLKLALKQLHKCPRESDHQFSIADCYLSLGALSALQKQYKKAEQNLSKSLEIYKKLYFSSSDEPAELDIARCYFLLGVAGDGQKEQHRAAECFSTALKLYQKWCRCQDHESLTNHFDCYAQLGSLNQEQYDTAEKYLKNSLVEESNLSAELHLYDIALCQFYLNRMKENVKGKPEARQHKDDQELESNSNYLTYVCLGVGKSIIHYQYVVIILTAIIISVICFQSN